MNMTWLYMIANGAGERGDGDAVAGPVVDLGAVAGAARAGHAERQHAAGYGHRLLRSRC